MKKYIFGLLSGIVIASVLNVYATIYYDASQINYKNTTLDHAIDDLYDRADRDISFGNVSIASSGGEKLATGVRTATLNINKGKYLVSITTALGASVTSEYLRYGSYSSQDLDGYGDLTCNNNCSIVSIGGGYAEGCGNTSTRSLTEGIIAYYYVTITSDNTTLNGVNSTWARSANNSYAEAIMISAIPISK